jgi:hypothetical protein
MKLCKCGEKFTTGIQCPICNLAAIHNSRMKKAILNYKFDVRQIQKFNDKTLFEVNKKYIPSFDLWCRENKVKFLLIHNETVGIY